MAFPQLFHRYNDHFAFASSQEAVYTELRFIQLSEVVSACCDITYCGKTELELETTILMFSYDFEG